MRVNSIPLEIGVAKDSAAVLKDTKRNGSIQVASPPVAQAPEQVSSAAAPASPVVNGLGLGLQFSVDRETGVRVIKVLNVENGEVVRQIPPDEVLAFLRHFDQTKGIFLSRRL
jgi:flagellar protein FlaG